MGAWGTGLYSGDFAMDLRGTIRAVARLPFAADRLVDVLCGTEPGAAKSPDDPDHTIFWLVVADQFAKRGIDSPRVRDTALSIIDQGRDRATMTALGMGPAALRRRDRMLAELRSRLASAPTTKPRPTLKKPQPYLMEIGDCYAYPASGGKNINPYFASPEKMHDWRHDGWALIVIIARGRAFDFLAWYRALTIGAAISEKPAAIPMDSSTLWVLRRPGTVTPLHIKRMRLEKLGCVTVDADKLGATFPGMKPGTVHAIEDISIANGMHVGPSLPARAMPRPGEPREARTAYPTILGLGTILAQ